MNRRPLARDGADRSACAAADGEAAEQPHGRKDRRNRADRETPAEAVHGSVPGRLLVLANHMDRTVLPAGDHRGAK